MPPGALAAANVLSVRVIIAGAGIAGLTAALSLHAAGIEPLVLDAARELRPLGVGINLLPHAVRELTELGLAGPLAAAGIETAEQAHFDRHGNLIWSEPRGTALGYRWPQYSVHRGQLQMILLEAVRGRLGAGAVRTVNRLGSRPAFTCGQPIGMDTSAPSRARGENGATAVEVRSLRR